MLRPDPNPDRKPKNLRRRQIDLFERQVRAPPIPIERRSEIVRVLAQMFREHLVQQLQETETAPVRADHISTFPEKGCSDE
jgi:hypothetical protein